MATFLLFEAASGYALFEALESDVIAAGSQKVQDSISDLARFSKLVKLLAYRPFASAAEGLVACNAASDGILPDFLASWLSANLPAAGGAAGGAGASAKKASGARYVLGVSDPKLGAALAEKGVPCECNDRVLEAMRGVRTHYDRLVSGLKPGDEAVAARGLAHAYSRSKVKFNVNRSDNMIIQSIATLDTLDKDINTLVMRVREWYAWHFPELTKLVGDNYTYARAALAVADKSLLQEADLPRLAEALGGDGERAAAVLAAARASMGQDISPLDLTHICALARRVVSLAEFRLGLAGYLGDKMGAVAPNLQALVGDTVGARLISHAGSLTNLAKYPASTVQILGAEKALFRALKTKGNTPKYGLIYHSTFIGRAQARNKGRISRYLANKCSIASRIDCFADVSTSAFGNKLREQVEQRLAFYDKGAAPTKNVTMMQQACADAGYGAAAAPAGAAPATPAPAAAAAAAAAATPAAGEKSKKKKRKGGEGGAEPTPAAAAAPSPAPAAAAAAAEAATAATPASALPKKKKKKAAAEAEG